MLCLGEVSLVLVTDIKRVINQYRPNESEITGFYMQQYLAQNLDGIERFLKKKWDVVGIVSGHGLVGVGKSTMAAQVGYYLAWRRAGGEMAYGESQKDAYVKTAPTKPVIFSMENVVFSPEQLIERAKSLHDKYKEGQVIIYDEGRAGLDSASAMTSINKILSEFFQRCRVYNHIILVVLPSFFKLHEDYSVARSLFLIDVFADKHFNRGYFNFYNFAQKEKLFFFGKKRIGTTAKYMATRENFWGKFGKWFPLNQKEYEVEKMKAIESVKKTMTQKKYMFQRDVCIYLLTQHTSLTEEEIAKEIRNICGRGFSRESVSRTRIKIEKHIEGFS